MTRARIGPYEVRAKVGEGGMGEVFKAWDPRLERDVAIKLLHPDAALNPDRQRRLLAEGRAASALNHPNILRVYDADVDGASYYLVSEWLEGKSLRDELSRGPLPLKRLLDLAVQIADGLAAAHAIGIVHRDIKPENVMLAKDGTARIVDFGLARSTPDGSTLSPAAGHATTVSLEGGLSGTPAYMSPEQARGTAGDFRTDQFSFGVLLYELATGKHAFRRESVAETLSAVLHEEPHPIADLNPRIPAPVRWVVERCLAKDVTERYAATEDLARELRWVRDRLSEALTEPKPTRKSDFSLGGWKGMLALTTALLIGWASPALLSPWRAEVAPPVFTPIATASQYEGAPSWSPDGESLAYVADVDGVLQVFIRRLGDAVSHQVTQGRFDAQRPFWTPDGQRLYYISLAGEHDALWSVGVAGGRPELALENVTHAAIDPEGKRLALLRWHDLKVELRESLWWSSPPGAEPVQEMRPPFDQFRTPDGRLRFSRDGQLLAWVYFVDDFNPVDPRRSSEFYILPKDSRPAQRVLLDVTPSTRLAPFDWLPDGRHVIVALPDANIEGRHLWLADTQSGRRQSLTATHTNETDPAVSPDGLRVAYASDEVDFDLVLITPSAPSRRTMLATARNELDPAWSPAGDQFAFVTDRSGRLEIWMRSRDGQWERPIVTASDFGASDTETFGALAFSPDGRMLAYQRQGEGTFEIWLSPSTGGAPVRLISKVPDAGARPYQDAPSWSPDGEWIAYQANEGLTRQTSLAKIRVGTHESITLAPVAIPFTRASWSPDGKWIAFEAPDGFARVPAEGGTVEILTPGPWLAFTWAPDSRHLFALGESEAPGHFALMQIDAATHDVRVLNPDLGSIPVANFPIRGFSFAKDHGLLTSLASARSDIWLLEGFQPPRGWLSRLLRLGR